LPEPEGPDMTIKRALIERVALLSESRAVNKIVALSLPGIHWHNLSFYLLLVSGQAGTTT